MPDLPVPDGELYFVVTQYLDSCPVCRLVFPRSLTQGLIDTFQGHGAFVDIGVSYNAIEYSGGSPIKRNFNTAIEYGL